MDEKIEVSVIIPTFNREDKIKIAIESVINQTFTNWELLIVDDFSTDGTEELINEFSRKDPRIKYLKNSRTKGVSGARNTGIINSKGEYIAFLDSDDEWLDFHLTQSISALEEENQSVSLSLWIEKTDGVLTDCDSTLNSKNALVKAVRFLDAKVRKDYYVFDNNYFEYMFTNDYHFYHINTLVIKKNVVEKSGLFKEGLDVSEDNDFIVRIFKYNSFCLIKRHSFIYNLGNSDSLYAFVDREVVKNKISSVNHPRDIIDDVTIKKLTETAINDIKLIEMRAKYVKESNILAKKKIFRELSYIDHSISFSVAYLNRYIDKKCAIKFYLRSFFIKPSSTTFSFLLNLFLPGLAGIPETVYLRFDV